MAATILLPPRKNECQRSVNDFRSCIMDTHSAEHRCWIMINPSATFVGNNATDNISTTSKWASTERLRFLAMHLGESKRYATAPTHNHSPSRLYGQKCYGRYRYHLLKMSVNGASTIFGLGSWTLRALCIRINPWSIYRPPIWAKC